jgi:hypothetical protein
MTTPDESHRAVERAREFLTDLMYPATTPRVPLAVRVRARRVLRHYPWGDEGLIRAAQVAVDRRGSDSEDVQAISPHQPGVVLDVENELG